MDVQSLLKTFQLSTRQLHHMCGHSKVFNGKFPVHSSMLHCILILFCYIVCWTRFARTRVWPITSLPWRRAWSCLCTGWRPCWHSTIVRRPFGLETWRTATWRFRAAFQHNSQILFHQHFHQQMMKCAAGGRDFVSEVSRKWGWWRGGGRAEDTAASGSVRGWGSCFLSVLQLSLSSFIIILQAFG